MASLLIDKSKIPATEILLIGFLPSFIKKIIYRMRGYKIGKGVSIGIGTVIIGEKVEIGDNTQIGFLTLIRGRVIKLGRFVEIGSTTLIDTEKIEIDDDSRITEMVFIGGAPTPQSHFKMGKRGIIAHQSFLNPTKELILGDDVGIGGNCMIYTHGGWQSVLEGYPLKFGNVHLGDNSWVARNCMVMPGISVGENATVGACSLISKNIPAGALAFGNPAKIIRTADDYLPKMTREDRLKILDHVFEEMCEYLDYHYYNSTIRKYQNYWHINTRLRKNTYDVYYFFQKSVDLDNIKIKINKNTIVFSYDEIDSQTRNKILSSGSMLIDLEKVEREGSTAIGEEVISYLKRYGLRFNRID